MLCIKYSNFLPPKSVCLPSGNVYIVCDERFVYVECGEGDRVEDNSGHLIKGEDLEVHEGSLCSGLEGIPVLKYSLSAIIKKNKGLQFTWSYPSRYGLGTGESHG